MIIIIIIIILNVTTVYNCELYNKQCCFDVNKAFTVQFSMINFAYLFWFLRFDTTHTNTELLEILKALFMNYKLNIQTFTCSTWDEFIKASFMGIQAMD